MNKRIRILFISTSYPEDENDWRGRFIANIVGAISCHHSIELNIWLPPGNFPENIIDVSLKRETRWLRKLMVQGGIAHILRTRRIAAVSTLLQLLYHLKKVYKRKRHVHIAHVNWLQNIIPLWGTTTPVVVSVLGSDLGLLKLPGMKSILRHVIRNRLCIIAPNADWMVSELKPVFGDIAEICPVPFGVDQMWFDMERLPFNKRKRKWIVITRLTRNKIGTLFDWGKGRFENSDEVHLFGPMQEKIKLPHWIIHHGPVSPDKLVKKWFPVCSGLITLSRHDEGRPQVMLEAMAAGLPVIASPLKAHKDIIQNGRTGYIVSSDREFYQALELLSHPQRNHEIGRNAKDWILKNIGTWDDCASRYINLYKHLILDKA